MMYLFTGKSIGRQDCYGEIHTGDAWEPACQLFCGDDVWNMPIALVLFGDKSHLDLHSSLSTLPIIFTLSCFNEESRNKAEFWRPLAFLPNLSYGAQSSKNFKKPSHHSYQDEHDCLKVAFSDLQRIHKQGCLSLIVMGKPVIGKVWIHYCVGDPQGNNQWLGHYNGSGNLNHPYRDCKCRMWDIDKPNPNCQYITHKDYFSQKSLIGHCTTESSKRDVCKENSKHNIDNTFMDEDLPLSDQIHGIFQMTPPERLHTTSEGLTKHMIDSLQNTIGDLGVGKKLMTKIENLHHTLHFDLKRNIIRDIPRGSARNGVLKNTLVSTTKRRGNSFRLLCLCHSAAIRDDLQTILIQSSIIPAKSFKCLKLYISMEEWFHNNNPKTEVWSAQRLVSKTLELIHHAFP
jgi:hypothetical protein